MDPMGHENAATFAQTRDFFSLSSHQKVALKMDDEMAKQFHRKIHFPIFFCLGIRQLVGGFKHLVYFP